MYEAPESLLKEYEKVTKPSNGIGGELEPAQLAELLSHLDVKEFQEYDRWLKLMMACHHATNGAGRDEFLDWSAGDAQYAGDRAENAKRWASFHGQGVSVGTLYHELKLAGKGELIPSAAIKAEESFDDDLPEEAVSTEEDDRPLTAAELAISDYEPPKFLWENFVLENLVNLLYGDGGTGKTLLALHLAVAVAAGIPLYGKATKQLPVLLMLAEDDYGETKARLQAICGMLNTDLAALPLHIWCRPNRVSILAVVSDEGLAKKGEFMPKLKEQLKKIAAPCLIVLDTVSDIAALKESQRPPVNTFCKQILGGLCKDFGATVLVNAHPSKTSMEDGHHYSGSTAWNNAVRNRLTFERVSDIGPERRLKVAKANYGPESELLLTLSGRLLLSPDATQRDEDQANSVLTVMREMRAQGIRIVRRIGDGQKAENIAEEVSKRFGQITTERVKAIIDRAERDGVIRYSESVRGKNGIKATYDFVDLLDVVGDEENS